ncbi:MAG: pyridoxine 5'-phosphate synthase [Pseudomonadota bacterium]
MTKLSVNLNKLALLRNQRDVGYPDLCDHARIILDAGAEGLTVHPRPDERHIRFSDIEVISNFLSEWPDQNIEFNIEGYPSNSFIDLVLSHHCDQVTLVPDAPDQSTSDHGWDVAEHKELLTKTIIQLKENGRRVSLFLDPDPDLVEGVRDVGADRIELYTGPYATKDISIDQYVQTAKTAIDYGLEVNAGHDLNLDNLAHFIEKIPSCAEVSIGHALTADALKLGWHAAVTAYLNAIEFGYKASKAR